MFAGVFNGMCNIVMSAANGKLGGVFVVDGMFDTTFDGTFDGVFEGNFDRIFSMVHSIEYSMECSMGMPIGMLGEMLDVVASMTSIADPAPSSSFSLLDGYCLLSPVQHSSGAPSPDSHNHA